MIRSVFTVILICIIFFSSFSQIKEKTYLAGGGLSLSYIDISHKENNSFNFSISPDAGYMFTDAFGMGLSLLYSISNSDDYKENNLGIGPYARYYFNKEMVSPFLTGIFEYEKKTTHYNGEKKINNSYLGAAFGPGIAFFINNHVSLEAMLTYKHLVAKDKGGGAYKKNNLDLIIGFQVYLPIENP